VWWWWPGQIAGRAACKAGVPMADRARQPLAARALSEPAASRLHPDQPRRDEILAAHQEALAADEPGYTDPVTGLFVLSAGFLAARGFCCEQGCRHCPYVSS
jgi:hypothetical protein